MTSHSATSTQRTALYQKRRMRSITGKDDGTVIRRVTTSTGDHPAWLVTNYEDVKVLLSDPRLGYWHTDPERRARVSQSAIFGGAWNVPLVDPVRHARMRRLLMPMLSTRRMASLRPRITAITAELLDTMARHGQPVDLHEAVSFPLPTQVICELLGVPYADQADFLRWSDDAARRLDAAHSQAGLMHVWEYLRALAARKQAEPDDDMVSGMVAAAATDPELTIDDIAQFSAALLFAGDASTVPAIDRGAIQLLTHPEQADALRHDPALIEPMVEEILRWSYQPPSDNQAAGLLRYANTDFTFDSTIIKTGELVILGVNAANCDEQRFPEPHRFNMYRTHNPHLAFGHGPHFCIGASLARVELQVLFPALLNRFPTLRLTVAAESPRERDMLFTGDPVKLPVTW